MLHVGTWCNTVLQGVTLVIWCYMVVHGVTRCYRVLHTVLHGVTGCCVVLHDVKGCYTVVHVVTRCYGPFPLLPFFLGKNLGDEVVRARVYLLVCTCACLRARF